MICTTRQVSYNYGDVIKIPVFSDAHLGSRWCDEKALRRDVEAVANDPHVKMVLLLGDQTDSIVCSDKRYRPSTHVAPGRDDVVDYEVDRAVDVFSPLRGKLAICAGNHEDVILKRFGTDPTQRICEKLEAEYLGFSFIMKLSMQEGNGNKRGRSVIIHGHHGHGGGSRTAGGNITKFDRDRAHFEADIYLRGHVHQRYAVRQTVIAHGGQKLLAKPQILAICGTYLRTLSNNTTPTYSEVKGFPPTEIGGVTICLQPDWGHPDPRDPGKGWVRMWSEA